MKIAILTQPLKTNYGGLLQAYALQKVLKDLGHEVFTVDIGIKHTFYKDFGSTIWRIVRKYIFHQKNIKNILPNRPSKSEYKIISQHTQKFIKNNIQTTEKLESIKKISILKKYNFEAFIVGSDQVWRPCYSSRITAFYLDFLGNDKTIKRIAYAASFGVDNWEYDEDLSKKCKGLAKKFNTISVRENSGVKLCKKYLDVNATHVLDPTMLLNQEDYISLINKDNTNKSNTLMVYVLDKSEEKEYMVQKISKLLNLSINTIMPIKKYSKKSRKNINDCIFPPVSNWLKGFIDAKYVITDSFHGTVFSIIFNKPFIAIANKDRGIARFSSLLKLFGLESRLIFSINELTDSLITNHINYDVVNKSKEKIQKTSMAFLKQI